MLPRTWNVEVGRARPECTVRVVLMYFTRSSTLHSRCSVMVSLGWRVSESNNVTGVSCVVTKHVVDLSLSPSLKVSASDAVFCGNQCDEGCVGCQDKLLHSAHGQSLLLMVTRVYQRICSVTIHSSKTIHQVCRGCLAH